MRPLSLPLAIATIACLTAHLALGDAPPARASGLWETSISMDTGMPSQKMKECVDQATDAEMLKTAMDTSKAMGGTCSKNTFTRTASGFESESVCTVGGSTISSKGTFTGDFASGYTGEVVTTYNPPLFGNGGSKTTFTAKHLGPCGADMKPGDIIMANGMKPNMKDAAAQAEKLSKTLKNLGGSEKGAPFGGDMGQAMMAAQGQMKAEDLKAMQDALKQMEQAGN